MRIELSDDPMAVWDDIETDIKKAYEAMYPGRPVEEEVGPQDMSLLAYPTGRMFVAITDEGRIAGCGGWVWLWAQGYDPLTVPRLFPYHTVEIKRLFVRPEFQGQGLAKRIDWTRQQDAKANGAQMVVGEAGDPQVASLELRWRTGYARMPRFGNMIDNPESNFFGKWLA